LVTNASTRTATAASRRSAAKGSMTVAITSSAKAAGRDLFLVPDLCLRFRHELGGHLSDSVLLRVLRGVFHHFFFGLSVNHMRASRGGIDLGTFEDLAHDERSFAVMLGHL
jgi:hypothetical protein